MEVKVYFNMEGIISTILALIVSMWNGVSYKPAEDKPFNEDKYYQTSKSNYPDDRLLYNATIASMEKSTQKSDFSPFPLDTSSDRKILDTGNAIFPFTLSADKDVKTVLSEAQSIQINKKKFYLFKVPKGTEIIAPYNSTLDNSSTIVGTIYPTKEPCFGVGMTIETETTTDKQMYKISYGCLNRLWFNMRKTKPDDKNDSNDIQPIYYPSEEIVDKIKFSQKEVLGEAGKTGVPSTYPGDAYISIRVEKYSNGSYVESTIEEMCNIK